MLGSLAEAEDAAQEAWLRLDRADAGDIANDKADPLPDGIWSEAADHFSEFELAGLLVTTATVNVWNRLNVVTRQVAGAEW
jgi:hypothetical protein